ncbi:unnamed protein product [Phytomonas sp. Hart1]|nr:unnamed protein product [Phytomonas sp. Hart1]|eukprot:CCW67664.1 unnamed protein product [Phytomonas sp. isolate Hart1]
MNPIFLQEIDDTQRLIDHWYQMTSASLHSAYHSFMGQLQQLEAHLSGEAGLLTPMLPLSEDPAGLHRVSPSVSHGPVDYDPFTDDGKEASADHEDPQGPPTDYNLPCQVLVQFKRKRILQYASPYYVAPGEYVVVGGDRGEDIGLVTHSRTPDGDAVNSADRACSKGVGEVLRVATAMEVTQLQSVQTELEARAVEVAQEKVQEHGLNMRIVDAEYQFDRRKLTFFYQAQQRLDFRNLVRDLYKTFRARIWMEPDTSS